jgi:hypothetical protein
MLLTLRKLRGRHASARLRGTPKNARHRTGGIRCKGGVLPICRSLLLAWALEILVIPSVNVSGAFGTHTVPSRHPAISLPWAHEYAADTGAYAADARTSKGVRRNAPSGAAVPERVNETARRFTPGGIFPMAAP